MSVRVTGLHLYPVKGLRGRDVCVSAVARSGLVGDRRWMVTAPDGHFLTQRQVARMAQIDAEPTTSGLLLRHDGESCTVDRPGPDAPRLDVSIWRSSLSAATVDPAADLWLSRVLGRPCRLVYMDDMRSRLVDPRFAGPDDHVGFADAYPLLAASLASLDTLNAALHAGNLPAVPMNRFRPNLTFSGTAPWAEDRWRRVRIGSMVFRAPEPCKRCVVITHDQRSGEVPEPGEPLRTLGRLNRHDNAIRFGANLIPEAAGTLSVGDPVEVLDWAT